MFLVINGAFLAALWGLGLLGPVVSGSVAAYFPSLVAISASTLFISLVTLKIIGVDFRGTWRNWSENLSRDIRLGVIFFSAELSLTLLLQWGWSLLGEPPHDRASEMIGGMIGRGAPAAVVMLFVLCVLVPVAEELFYKRLLYAGVRKGTGALKAVLLCSAVFALSHSVQAAVLIFPGSIISHYMYERYRRLPANIIMHSLINFSAVIAAII